MSPVTKIRTAERRAAGVARRKWMEYIVTEDLRRHLEVLRKYVRPVGPGEHPTLYPEGVRDVDFAMTPDRQWVLPSDLGLSFVTNMRKLKKILSSKGRFFEEVDVFAFDDTFPLPPGLIIVRDGAGHASLRAVVKMKVSDLIPKLEDVSRRMEKIGRIKLGRD
jgi:hypothetical protein